MQLYSENELFRAIVVDGWTFRIEEVDWPQIALAQLRPRDPIEKWVGCS